MADYHPPVDEKTNFWQQRWLITHIPHPPFREWLIFPIHRCFRKIAFKELKGYKVRAYRPILEYGGWGIRFGLKGKAYNVSGNRGVQLELTNGKRLLIGSQRPEELWQAIQAESGGRWSRGDP